MENVLSVSGLLNIARKVSPIPSLDLKLKLDVAVFAAQITSALVVSSFMFERLILHDFTAEPTVFTLWLVFEHWAFPKVILD